MSFLQLIFQKQRTITDISADEDRFRIKAVGGGFIARLLGLGDRLTMTFDTEGYRHKVTYFSGEESVFIPRHNIVSTVFLMQKPVEWLFGIPFVIMSSLPLILARQSLYGILLLLGGCGLLIAIYLLSKKRVVVGFLSSGGTLESLKMKLTLSDLQTIKDGLAIVDSLISVVPTTSSVPAPAPRPRSEESYSPPPPPPPPAGPSWKKPAASPPPPPPSSDGTRIISCPSCHTQMSVPDNAIGKKVRCVSCREVFRAEG